MKKIIKVVLIILLIFIFLNIVKNIILFLTYEYGNENYIKISNRNSKNLEGFWKITYDTYIEGYDERNIIEYKINKDSTGIYKNIFFLNRAFGFRTEPYSWLSLLPFDKESSKVYFDKIVLTTKYILYIPNNNSYHSDTLYSHYEFVNNKLRIDINKFNAPNDSSAVWMPYSSKRSEGIYKLIYAGLFLLK